MMKIRNNQNGQVAVEYIMLLVVVVVLYASMMNLMTKRDPNGDPKASGFIIKAWDKLNQNLGQDFADDADP